MCFEFCESSEMFEFHETRKIWGLGLLTTTLRQKQLHKIGHYSSNWESNLCAFGVADSRKVTVKNLNEVSI
jgi:hypothetical protein